VNSQSSTIIQQVRVFDPLTKIDRIADVWIEEGIIKAIESQLPLPENIISTPGHSCIFAPGLVDIYSNSGEPGHEDRENLASLIEAATNGGFTRVAILPNTQPPLDHPALLSTLQQKSQGFLDKKSARLQFWASLTLGRQGQQMTELADLMPFAVGFTDNRSLEDLGLLRHLLEYLKPFGQNIALSPLNQQLRGNGVMREGENSIRFGLPSDPAISETTALAAILEIVAEIGTPVHLMRISTRRGVELIGEAKARGLPITASVTWLHLLLNTKAIATYNPSLHLDPPLGNESDRLALIEAIKEGIIDTIAIDHRPYTYEEKTVSFAEAPPGAIGLELALPLLWDKLVISGQLSALQLWQALSVNPCHCLQQKPPSLTVGNPAEAILFNPQATWTVTANNLHSLSHNTFWLNRSITGKVVQMWNF
jgi:dihydroorotase